MPATISEAPTSRSFTLGQQTVRELQWTIVSATVDDDEEVEVYDLLNATAPATYRGLLLDSVNADPQGNGVWKAYARYVNLENDDEFTFDTGGGSQRITQSLATISSYAPPGFTAPNFQGAIGVSEDAVEGVDIIIPAFEWTETHRFNFATVDDFYDYQDICYALTGRTNQATFRRKAAGEVLILQISGGKRGDDLAQITFRFAASPNQTGLSVGSISGITKAGHDYLWVRYADYVDSAGLALVKRPVACYVERVYPPGDYTQLNIGT